MVEIRLYLDYGNLAARGGAVGITNNWSYKLSFQFRCCSIRCFWLLVQQEELLAAASYGGDKAIFGYGFAYWKL